MGVLSRAIHQANPESLLMACFPSDHLSHITTIIIISTKLWEMQTKGNQSHFEMLFFKCVSSRNTYKHVFQFLPTRNIKKTSYFWPSHAWITTVPVFSSSLPGTWSVVPPCSRCSNSKFGVRSWKYQGAERPVLGMIYLGMRMKLMEQLAEKLWCWMNKVKHWSILGM